MPHKFVIAVLMEYIRSLNQFQIPVQVPSEGYLLSYIRGIRSGHRRSKKRWLFRVQNSGWFLTWQLFLLVLVENTVTAKLWPGREFRLLQPQPAMVGNLVMSFTFLVFLALLTRTCHQDPCPAQPLLHAPPVPAVPRAQRLQAFGLYRWFFSLVVTTASQWWPFN